MGRCCVIIGWVVSGYRVAVRGRVGLPVRSGAVCPGVCLSQQKNPAIGRGSLVLLGGLVGVAKGVDYRDAVKLGRDYFDFVFDALLVVALLGKR